MESSMVDLSFYKNKKVFITGHTGFKGSWMVEVLLNAGAKVSGYSLGIPAEPCLFSLLGLYKKVESFYADIRDYDKLKAAFDSVKPDIVIHMAAQPLVRESYKDPLYTYSTNILGTVNILECIRNSACTGSFLNVTTDKVYRNREWEWGYREDEELCGRDPYSNSKSCSELVTHSYKSSFFTESDGSVTIPVSTARAGNVIGGGDFSKDRIIPDCVRACYNKEKITVRNPLSVRPYQHVLEPVMAYLMVAAKQYENHSYAGCYNVGPDESDCFKTADLASLFVECWGGGAEWVQEGDGGPHEDNYLKLDCSKIKSVFGWKPRWNLETVVYKTVEWSKCWISGGNISECMDKQIREFILK